MSDTPEQILNQYGCSVTEERLSILNIFLQSSGPLDHTVLEKRFAGSISRATVYRTLRKFAGTGLLQVLPSVDGVIRYILTIGMPPIDRSQYIYFLCSKCGMVRCLINTPFPKINMPENYKAESTEVVVKGVCARCG